MNFFADAHRGVTAEVLYGQRMFPFVIDGFNAPTKVVAIDKFRRWEGFAIQ